MQLLAGVKTLKLGNLNSIRDFNYVKDTINGFIEIARSDKTIGSEINIASGQAQTMLDLANTLINKINPETKIIIDKKDLGQKI